ncbi:MAG: exodeoxyribonuclease V subunit gamma [Bacteroidaceae bacterium]|nr:exodeoxyribonuclease V subunit gamma [Bacteroidaceae bacterium]
MSNNLLDDLNPAQREAVQYIDGPSLVIAGAGSGKTRVLTYKIAYLLSQGMAPWSILALTFTNKAAEEMKTRIAQQVGEEQAQRLWMGTFHSIFARILRIEHEIIGFSSDFTIYDAADSKSLVKSIIREMQLDEKIYKPGTVLSHISAAKNRLILPSQYQSNPEFYKADQASKIPATGEIYRRYWARCRQADAMDFDDILIYTYLLFAKRPEVLAKYEDRFDFVLVDEYQDTNYAQHAIVWQLSQHKKKVCVVGDDAQSIYSFRGANIDNILTFQKLYEGARLFKLERNYRSTQNIVNAANSVIKHNRGQIYKEVYSEKTQGDPIHVYSYYSDLEEAAGVAKKIVNLHRYDHYEWDDIAILYRTNAQSRTFEEAFRKQDIPYRIYGGTSFYQRKEIKDVIAYFRLTVNPNDEEALKRVINYPARGIGQTSQQKLLAAASENNISVWQVLSNPEAFHVDINRGTAAKVYSFVQLIESFRSVVNQEDAAHLGKRIAQESGIVAEIFRGREPEDIARQENLQELLDGLQQFVDDRVEEEGSDAVYMSHYLQEVALVSDLDESDDDQQEKVSLMTIHAAKGLEFRVVFVVGMEENLFPNQMSSSSPREMEEERRLFYVALTRAEERCYLSHAQSRYRNGKSEFATPSCFIGEIDPRFIKQENEGVKPVRPRSFSKFGLDEDFMPSPMPRYRQQESVRPSAPPVSSRYTRLSSSSATSETPVQQTQTSAGTLTVGSRIEHARFGQGTVTALTGTGIDAKATVNFDNVGTKQLLLRFAKFEVIL